MQIHFDTATDDRKAAEALICILGQYYGIVGAQAPADATAINLPFAGNEAAPAMPAPATVPDTPCAMSPEAAFAPGVGVPGAGDAGNVLPAGPAAGPAGSSAPPPPVMSASAPLVPQPSTANGVELDAAGYPWDPRIHSLGDGGTHPKTDKGMWRKKRGVQPLEISNVEAQLRQMMALPQAPVVAPQFPAPPAAMLPGGIAPAAPVVPQPPAPPAAPADPTNFAELMMRVAPAIAEGVIPQSAPLEAVTAYGVPQLPMLASRPDLIAPVWTLLRATYPALK